VAEDIKKTKREYPLHGWGGIGLIALGLILTLMSVDPVAKLLLPMGLTGYVLAMDGWVLMRRGESLLNDRIGEFFLMMGVSIVGWLVIELYNQLLLNWKYVGLMDYPFWKTVFLIWIYAMVFPSVFVTYQAFDGVVILRSYKPSPMKWLNGAWVFWSVLFGILFLLLPIWFPGKWELTLVLFGIIMVLEPINYTFDRPSLVAAKEQGHREKVDLLVLSGIAFGIVVEVINLFAGFRVLQLGPFGYATWLGGIPFLRFFLYGLLALVIFELNAAMTGYPGCEPYEHPALQVESDENKKNGNNHLIK
jgi:hypothetical protein